MARTVAEFLERARQALDRGDWNGAFAILAHADSRRPLDAEALELLGRTAVMTGDFEVALSAWERAHAARADAGDDLMAAAAALQAASLLNDIGSRARTAGWIRQAERILAGMDDTPVHGWLAITKAVIAMVDGDIEGLIDLGRRGREIGERFSDPTLQAAGIHWEGRALILQGKVNEGMALLGEAASEATSGRLDPLSTAYLYCSTVCAAQGVADYRSAEEWTRAMEGWCDRQHVSYFPGLCRVHRVEILRLRGAWPEAEGEALRACQELQAFGPGEIGWALHELGIVRLRLGDLDGAEQAFLQAHERGRPPLPGLALLQLARGDVPAAAASIRSVVDHPPDVRSFEAPLNTPLGRTTLLPAQVEIALAAGDLDRARWASRELAELANLFETDPIRAASLAANGAVALAEGDADVAAGDLRAAVELWSGIGAPYEAARARMGLAEAYRAVGDESMALLELRTARATFERLAARGEADRARRSAGDPPATAGRRERKTFMFTDIVGSTNLLEAIGDADWSNLLRWHNERVTSLVEEHRGEVLRTIGDGFFVAFDSPADAAACAVAIQRALDEHRRTSGFAPRIRIGFHATEATREGDDYEGKGVHTAARIGALADGEEIVTDVGTFEAAGTSFGASSPRIASLKGLAEPVEVVSIDWR
jgi:class 3 adenylate cyclase